MYLDDLGELIFRIFDNLIRMTGVLKSRMCSIFVRELETAILKLLALVKADRSENGKTVKTVPDSRNMIEKENWKRIRSGKIWLVSKISILEDLKDQYQIFLIEGRTVKTGTDLF